MIVHSFRRTEALQTIGRAGLSLLGRFEFMLLLELFFSSRRGLTGKDNQQHRQA
jgi:hypothetical protein